MIHEYALEPELVASWTDRRDARYYAEMFGLGQPRLVSRFPKSWKRLAFEALDRTLPAGEDMQRTRAVELIQHLSQTMVHRAGSAYDPFRPWLDNAEEEHDRKPFQAILARENPRTREEILMNEDLEEGRSPRWAVARGTTVPRQARDMAEAVRSLLGCCRRVIFIDPHFGPEMARYRRPLESFLQALVDGRATNDGLRVEVHTGVTATADFFRSSCEKDLCRHIPAGLRVELRRWRAKPGGEVLHNRYILTDVGGVMFSHGLDHGGAGETDDVTLMDRDQYVLRWEQYAGDAPAFDLAEEPVVVVGIRRSR